MGIWTHSLKFNIGTCGIHQLPQTTGDGIHSLLREVVWDVGDNVPNPVLQFFHCARFCPVHVLLCQPHRKKSQGVRSGLLAGHSWVPRRPSQRPGNFWSNQARTIVHENKFIDVFPVIHDRPHVIFQHLKIAFGIHCVTQEICADDPSGRHSAPHGHFWTILHLLHCHFGIVCRPVMAIMSIDETAGMENGLVTPQNAVCSNLHSFLNSQAASRLC